MQRESKFLDSLRIKAKILQKNKSVRNVNKTPYTYMKNMVSCNAVFNVTMLSLGSLELLLRASVFTALNLNEMGVTTLPRMFSGQICLGW